MRRLLTRGSIGRVRSRMRVGVVFVGLVASTTVALPHPAIGAAASISKRAAASAPVDEIEEAADKPLADAAGEIAAQQLVKDHGISMGEARIRIARQEDLFELATSYQDDAGSSWAGAYIDHEHGGRLVVQTSSKAVTGRLGGKKVSVNASVEVKTVEHSLAEINKASQKALGDVQGNGFEAAVFINPKLNRAELQVGVSTNARSDVSNAVATANAGVAPGKGDLVVLSSKAPPVETACQGAFALCDAPLRGGVGMRRTTDGGLCTTGFNVYSLSDSKPYVLTAGHCLENGAGDIVGIGASYETEFADGSRHQIGTGYRDYRYTSPETMDVGLISVNPNPAGWNIHNHVLVTASTGVRPTISEPLYEIEGVHGSSSVPGGYLCHTGYTYRGTKCGEFIGSGMTHPSGGPGGDNLGVVAMESCGGDSGGPIFIYNDGYGILVRGGGTMEDHGERDNGLGNSRLRCYDQAWYEGLAGALARTNTNIRTS